MKSLVYVVNHETREAFEGAVQLAYRHVSHAVPTEERLQRVAEYAGMVFSNYGKGYGVEVGLIDDARLIIDSADGILYAVATCEFTDYGLPRPLDNALQLIGFKHEVENTVDMRIVEHPEPSALERVNTRRLVSHIQQQIADMFNVMPEHIDNNETTRAEIVERVNAAVQNLRENVALPAPKCATHTIGRHEVVQTKRGPQIHVFSAQTGLHLETYKLRSRRKLKKKIRQVTDPSIIIFVVSYTPICPAKRIVIKDTE